MNRRDGVLLNAIQGVNDRLDSAMHGFNERLDRTNARIDTTTIDVLAQLRADLNSHTNGHLHDDD